MASGRDEVKSLSNNMVTYRTVNARRVACFGAKIRFPLMTEIAYGPTAVCHGRHTDAINQRAGKTRL